MHWGGEEMHTHFQWGKLAGSDNLDDLSNDGKILKYTVINPLNPELNPICCLLALLGANHFLHVSRIKVK